MNITSSLWHRIQEYQFDDPTSAFPFSRKLAAENGWSHQFALRVLEEYRKFVYLGMNAGHKVSPSDAVDQAWHLHQLYSKEYWENFCPYILGRPFHHGPTKGGEENPKFEHLYECTKSSYQRIFRTTPPEDIWPDTVTQFGREFLRLNTHDFLIIKKDDFPLICRVVVLVLNLVLKLRRK
jgi:hypothetical protein